eukprot:jgi/Bigna1/77602/fgenesh1_pg.49_\
MATRKDSPAVWVYVVRHGEVENPRQVFYGRLPGFGISKKGKEQAAIVGQFLKERSEAELKGPRPMLLVSSPMQRAQETAKIVCEKLGISTKIKTEEGMNEVKSPFQGKSLEYMSGIKWELYDPKNLTAIGAYDEKNYETFEACAERVVKAVVAIARKASSENKDGTPISVVATSHGDCCQALRYSP